MQPICLPTKNFRPDDGIKRQSFPVSNNEQENDPICAIAGYGAQGMTHIEKYFIYYCQSELNEILAEFGEGGKILSYATVPIILQAECETYYPDIDSKFEIQSNNICAGYVEGRIDSCFGDAGGPLLCYQGTMCLTS